MAADITSTQAPAAPVDTASASARLSFGHKASFATGDIVDGTINFGLGVFIFYYLTAVCGLSGTMAGALLALSTVIDAFADPLIGSITDNTRSKLGRRLPYMLVAAFPTAIAFGLIFSVPSALSGWALTAYVGATLLVLRLATSFFFLPYAAVSAELSSDYTERSVLFAHRTFFNCVGNVILLTLGYWVYMHGHDGLLNRAAYASFGWTVAAVALSAALLSTYSAYRQRHRLHTPHTASRFGVRQLLAELGEVRRNRSFGSLFICCLFFWTSIGIASTLGIHANLYFWRLPEDVIATLPLVNIAGYAAGVPFSTLLLRWFEKRDVALIGFTLMCGTQLVLAPLQIAGVLPEGAPLFIILGVAAFFAGFAGTCAFVSCGSMMSDAVDEHDLMFGARREGLFFAGLLFSIKAAAGLGGFVGGTAMDLIGFPRDLTATAAQEIPQAVVNHLGLVHGPLAALLGIAGALTLSAYRINRTELSRIQAALAQRTASTA